MEEIRADIAPMLSAHSDKILLNNMLFKKIEELYNNRNTLKLDDESVLLIEKVKYICSESLTKICIDIRKNLKKPKN